MALARPMTHQRPKNQAKKVRRLASCFQRSSRRGAGCASLLALCHKVCDQEGQAARANSCSKALRRVHCPDSRQLRVTAMGRPARRKSLVEHPGDALVGRSVVADGSLFHESPTQKFPGKVTGTSETSGGKGLTGQQKYLRLACTVAAHTSVSVAQFAALLCVDAAQFECRAPTLLRLVQDGRRRAKTVCTSCLTATRRSTGALSKASTKSVRHVSIWRAWSPG